jgi:hypothetical protein
MAIFYVRGVTGNTANTIDHALFGLWNPSGTKRIDVLEVALFITAPAASSDGYWISRTSAQGTAGSTVTPTAANSLSGDAVPDSGATLDLAAYSVQPTLLTPQLWGWAVTTSPGFGFIWQPRGIKIPPGSGLCLHQRLGSVAPICEVTIVFQD